LSSNSFVAPYPYYEYQSDLAFSDLPIQKNEQGMICIDIFTKFGVVVPIKSKKNGVAVGILKFMPKLGKKPEIIDTDDEGTLHKPSLRT
jgi:hypothetical protein